MKFNASGNTTNDDIWLRVRPVAVNLGGNFNAYGESLSSVNSDVIVVNVSKRCLIPGPGVITGTVQTGLTDRPDVDQRHVDLELLKREVAWQYYRGQKLNISLPYRGRLNHNLHGV